MFRSPAYKRVYLIITLKIIQHCNTVVVVENFLEIKLYAVDQYLYNNDYSVIYG